MYSHSNNNMKGNPQQRHRQLKYPLSSKNSSSSSISSSSTAASSRSTTTINTNSSSQSPIRKYKYTSTLSEYKEMKRRRRIVRKIAVSLSIFLLFSIVAFLSFRSKGSKHEDDSYDTQQTPVGAKDTNVVTETETNTVNSLDTSKNPSQNDSILSKPQIFSQTKTTEMEEPSDANINIISKRDPSLVSIDDNNTTTEEECQRLEQIRTMDKIPLDPSTQSIFNCHAPFGKCQYYRPAHFFHPNCGIAATIADNSTASDGKNNSNIRLEQLQTIQKFEQYLQEMIELRDEQKLWPELGQPPIIIPWVTYTDEVTMRMNQNVQINHEWYKNEINGRYNITTSNDENNSPLFQKEYQENGQEQQRQKQYKRHNLSFIHVHKTGGTSVVSAMTKHLEKLINGSNNRKYSGRDHKIEEGTQNNNLSKYKGMQHVYAQSRSKAQNKKQLRMTEHLLKNAVRYQAEDGWDDKNDDVIDSEKYSVGSYNDLPQSETATNTKHMMMALVRDPVERFISSVGQVTSTKSSKKGAGKRLKEICILSSQLDTDVEMEVNGEGESGSAKMAQSTTTAISVNGQIIDKTNNNKATTVMNSTTTSDVFRCIVNIIKKEGYWIDVHFTPMILELSFATMQKDVPIAIFPFKTLPEVLINLGFDPRIKKKDGSKAGYRSNLLTNATIDDLHPDVLEDLCHLYLMDVLFMRDLGFETNCDSFFSTLMYID